MRRCEGGLFLMYYKSRVVIVKKAAYHSGLLATDKRAVVFQEASHISIEGKFCRSALLAEEVWQTTLLTD